MAYTLAEAAKLSRNPLQRGVIETFVQTSPVLDRMPLKPIDGNAYGYNEELTLPGVEFRAINAAYAESTGTVNPKSESLVALGGDADVDTFLVQTQAGNTASLRQEATTGKVKAASYKFQDAFVNGDVAVDANSFDGLKKRLTGGQVVSAATNGLPVVGADDAARHAFLDKLDELLAAVPGATDMYMNAAVLSKYKSSARRLTIYDQTIDTFGRQVVTYNGVRMHDIGSKADGTLIIPQTETQGSSSLASSIYAVKFGGSETDQAVTGLTNGGIQVKDLGEIDAKPVFRTRIEFFCGLAVFGGKAAGRLSGVLAS
jgi:hypothetical protein